MFLLYLFGLTIGVSALEAENLLGGIGLFMFGVTLAAAAGLMAVLRRGERSILMIFPTLLGVSVLFLEMGEVLHRW